MIILKISESILFVTTKFYRKQRQPQCLSRQQNFEKDVGYPRFQNENRSLSRPSTKLIGLGPQRRFLRQKGINYSQYNVMIFDLRLSYFLEIQEAIIKLEWNSKHEIRLLKHNLGR